MTVVSQGGICNLALSLIGDSIIESLTEASAEARECNRVYVTARDAVLRDHAWGFGTKRSTLPLLTNAPTDWKFKYSYPSDCVRGLSLLPAVKNGANPPFEVALEDDGIVKIILTDAENAVLRYTSRVENPALYDAPFIQALSASIASRIALPLTGDPELMQMATAIYVDTLNSARKSDAGEGEPEPTTDAVWIKDRA